MHQSKPAPILIEQIFNAPVNTVWEALTNSGKLREWYFNIEEFRAEAGFEFSFAAGPPERSYIHRCRVTKAVPYKKLAYTWQYDGFEGSSEVVFELWDEGENTRIKLTHQGLESFPAQPQFAAENFAAGWTAILGTQLKQYVEK